MQPRSSGQRSGSVCSVATCSCVGWSFSCFCASALPSTVEHRRELRATNPYFGYVLSYSPIHRILLKRMIFE